MTIPDYQTVMLPLLRFAADGQEHSLREAIERLADHFGLDEEERTPREMMEDAYATIRTQLAGELLGRIASSSPQFFERLVVDLLVAMGYGGTRRDAGEAVGGSGDEGIDGMRAYTG